MIFLFAIVRTSETQWFFLADTKTERSRFHWRSELQFIRGQLQLIITMLIWQYNLNIYSFMKQIVTKQNRSLTLKLQSKRENIVQRNLGSVTIHAEETVASRNVVKISFRCSRLDNKDVFSKSVQIQYPATYLFMI